MFDAELRKPSSLAIGAFTEEGDLVGYAFVSRYVDAWHVMNVAVATEFRRRGIASALLERTFAVTTSDPRRGYTLEARVSNTGAIRLYERLGFEPRGSARLLHGQPRGRADHVARALVLRAGLVTRGTHGSPTNPLLGVCVRLHRSWAPAGQSPAPPGVFRHRPRTTESPRDDES